MITGSALEGPSDAWLSRIRNYVLPIFRCGLDSIHGPDHWHRVDGFALRIAFSTKADVTVVRLFALLHDSCRVNDREDPEHGPRAAEMLDRIVPSVFPLDHERLELLKHAVRLHTSGLTSPDPTVGTCWDADRLDISRAGIVPSPDYMSTAAGKKIAWSG